MLRLKITEEGNELTFAFTGINTYDTDEVFKATIRRDSNGISLVSMTHELSGIDEFLDECSMTGNVGLLIRRLRRGFTQQYGNVMPNGTAKWEFVFYMTHLVRFRDSLAWSALHSGHWYEWLCWAYLAIAVLSNSRIMPIPRLNCGSSSYIYIAKDSRMERIDVPGVHASGCQFVIPTIHTSLCVSNDPFSLRNWMCGALFG